MFVTKTKEMSSSSSTSSLIYDNSSRTEVSALPKGWIREEVPRLSGGITAGRKTDIFYISPTGTRIRSKPELVKYLGDHIDLSCFDYQTGKWNPRNKGNVSLANSSGGSGNKKIKGNFDFVRNVGNDSSLVPPIRQTASIFKQPVTVVKSSTSKDSSKVRSEFKPNNGEKPRQLFWEKRLSGLRASYPDEDYEPFSLPFNLKPIGPNVKQDIILASIATNMHMGNGAITGQMSTKELEKNPCVYYNPEQPLIAGVSISQGDIEIHEARVEAARKELQDALNDLTN